MDLSPRGEHASYRSWPDRRPPAQRPSSWPMPGRPPSGSHRWPCAPIIVLLIRVRGPASDATVLTVRCAAAPLLDGDCPLPPRLEMSGSAPACQRLVQIVQHCTTRPQAGALPWVDYTTEPGHPVKAARITTGVLFYETGFYLSKSTGSPQSDDGTRASTAGAQP